MTLTLMWAKGGALLRKLLCDEVSIFTLGEPVTAGIKVTRQATLQSEGVPALIQSTGVQTESGMEEVFSIKLPGGCDVAPGMLILMTRAHRESSMEGVPLLVDTVNDDGVALIRRASARRYTPVQPQGKYGGVVA